MSGIDAVRPSRNHPLCAILVLVAVSASVGDGRAQNAFIPEPGVKGFGVRGVPGMTLDQMLAACAGTRSSGDADAQVRFEECSQLRRSLKTQPGNSTSRR